MASSARTRITNNLFRSHKRRTPTRTIDRSIHRIPRQEHPFLCPDPDFDIYVDPDVVDAQAPSVAGPPAAPAIAPQRDSHDQHQHQHLTPLALPLPALPLPSPPLPLPSLSSSASSRRSSAPHPKIRGRKVLYAITLRGDRVFNQTVRD
ncbi:MAG: hypothetical protein Q9193_002595, partial [Seirophora villosa]